MHAVKRGPQFSILLLFVLAFAAVIPADALAAVADTGPETAYRTSGVRASLDEAALKQAMAVYWSAAVNKLPPFKDGDPVALKPGDFRILAKVPVQKGPNVYFAVKLGLRDAKSYYLAPPFPLSMVVDPTGTLFFSKVIDIARGEEAILKRAPSVTRAALPPDLHPATVKVGTGMADVTLISDPFCGFCRKGYAFASAHMDKILALRVFHHVLFEEKGSAVAAWMTEYARSRGADMAAVYDFTYTELRPAGQQASDEGELFMSPEAVGEDILTQYQRKFPALFEETGGDVPAMYRLLAGKYERETMENQDKLVKAQLTSTPVFVIDGEIVRGFDEPRLKELLSIVPDAPLEDPAPTAQCGSGAEGLCTD